MIRRTLSLVLLAAALLPLGGCFSGNLGDAVIFFFTGKVLPASNDWYKAKESTKLEESVTADVSATFGGLDGTYSVTLDNPSGGTFGSFSGTGTVKRGRFVTLKDSGTQPLLDTVGAMLSVAVGGEDVSVTKAKATVNAFQTPGGVEKHFKVAISFSATISTGVDAGKRIKGKIAAEGQF